MLSKDAEIIQRWSAKNAVTERRSFLIEKKVFLAAYAIRKLIQAGKLSSSFEDRGIRCDAYPARKERQLTRHNNHQLDRAFDFDAAEKRTIGVPDLLDMVIHSLVFAKDMNENQSILGFLTTSEKSRSHLWNVSLIKYLAVMRLAANDYPSALVRVPKGDSDDWIEWRGHGKPPRHIMEKLAKAR